MHVSASTFLSPYLHKFSTLDCSGAKFALRFLENCAIQNGYLQNCASRNCSLRNYLFAKMPICQNASLQNLNYKRTSYSYFKTLALIFSILLDMELQTEGLRNIQNTVRLNYSAPSARHVSIYWLGFYVLILLPSLGWNPCS